MALLWVVHTNNWEGRHSGILLRWDRPTAQAGTGKEEGKRCDWKILNLEILADFILVIVEQLLALLENFLDLRNGSGAVDQLGHVVGVRPHVGHDQGKQGNRFAGACSCEKKTVIQPIYEQKKWCFTWRLIVSFITLVVSPMYSDLEIRQRSKSTIFNQIFSQWDFKRPT